MSSALPNDMLFELSAYHAVRDPGEVTLGLDLIPGHVIYAGEPSLVPELGPIPNNGWFYVGHCGGSLREEGSLAWLLSHIRFRIEQLTELLSGGWDIYILLDQLPDDTIPAVPGALRQECNELGLSIAISPAYGLIHDA